MGTQINDEAKGLTIGGTTSEKIGFWNTTPVDQPASANQAAAVQTTFAGNTATTNATATFNSDIANVTTLVNQLRTDLVEIGIIKGSA